MGPIGRGGLIIRVEYLKVSVFAETRGGTHSASCQIYYKKTAGCGTPALIYNLGCPRDFILQILLAAVGVLAVSCRYIGR